MGDCNFTYKNGKKTLRSSVTAETGAQGNISDNDISRQISENAPTRLTKSELPELEGTPSDISRATEIRNEFGRAMRGYALERDNDGRPISREYSKDMLRGDIEARVKLVKDLANRQSSEHPELYSEKLKDNISLQKELNERYTRYKDIFTKHKTAAWWIKNENYNYFRKYIDGKTDKPGQ